MKTTLTLLFASFSLLAQTGTVTITSLGASISATAGASNDPTQIVCTGLAGGSAGASTMQMSCTVGGKSVLPQTTFTVPTTGGIGLVFGIQAGANSVTWLLTKGNPTPDSWSVSANGTVKTGSF
jgi:hypothetical protein